MCSEGVAGGGLGAVVGMEPEPAEGSTAARFAAGDRVEMRPVRWYDDLYWLGTVQACNADGTYRVLIENGDCEDNLPPDPKHIIPYSRTEIFAGPEVLVFDGHSLVPGEGGKGAITPIRLLSFRSSPHLYQSGCLLDGEEGNRTLRWAPVAFEIIQAMITTMAFLYRRSQGAAGGPYDSAWIGGGSGTCPMTARRVFPELLRRIDVVELSPEVMRVAQGHFGLEEDEVVHCHVGDGTVFLADAAPGSYDLICIDAADHDAAVSHVAATVPHRRLLTRWAAGGRPLHGGSPCLALLGGVHARHVVAGAQAWWVRCSQRHRPARAVRYVLPAMEGVRLLAGLRLRD